MKNRGSIALALDAIARRGAEHMRAVAVDRDTVQVTIVDARMAPLAEVATSPVQAVRLAYVLKRLTGRPDCCSFEVL